MRAKTKVEYKSCNNLIMSDKDITIMIIKKPKQRYRTIIRTHYKNKNINKLRGI